MVGDPPQGGGTWVGGFSKSGWSWAWEKVPPWGLNEGAPMSPPFWSEESFCPSCPQPGEVTLVVPPTASPEPAAPVDPAVAGTVNDPSRPICEVWALGRSCLQPLWHQFGRALPTKRVKRDLQIPHFSRNQSFQMKIFSLKIF